MRRIKQLSFFSDLYNYKIIKDEKNTEYVVFNNSNLNCVSNLRDKTEFEALENHKHLINNISKKEFFELLPIAESLGKSVFYSLRYRFPTKNFVVYVSLEIRGAMIIRFHQKWSGESYYYSGYSESKNEKIFVFE